jgi:hypothetical protein
MPDYRPTTRARTRSYPCMYTRQSHEAKILAHLHKGRRRSHTQGHTRRWLTRSNTNTRAVRQDRCRRGGGSTCPCTASGASHCTGVQIIMENCSTEAVCGPGSDASVPLHCRSMTVLVLSGQRCIAYVLFLSIAEAGHETLKASLAPSRHGTDDVRGSGGA